MRYDIKPEQIEAWVARHFDQYKKRRGGLEIVMPNPFVNDDKFKFNICLEKKASKHNPDYATYWVHDWREKYQCYDSSFVKFVQRYKGISYYEAIKDVGGKVHRTIIDPSNLEEDEQEDDAEQLVEPPDGALFFRDSDNSMIKKIALNYLNKRAITEQKAKAYGLGYSADNIILFYYEYTLLVYWQTRSLFGKVFRFPENTNKSDFLYGFDTVEPTQTVYIVESPIDAITIGDGALAIGGDAISKKQVRKLRMLLPGKVIICTDNDDSGRALIKDIYFNIKPFFKHIYYVLPPHPYKDWNEYEVKKGYGSAVSYINNHAARLTPPTALRFQT